jgi:hypothetical protein
MLFIAHTLSKVMRTEHNIFSANKRDEFFENPTAYYSIHEAVHSDLLFAVFLEPSI